MFACTTLIESDLSKFVDWTLVDTTAYEKNRSGFSRLVSGISRILKVMYYLVFKDIEVVMAFSSKGMSFIEKGIMIRIAKVFGKRTIIAPRSGLLIDNFDNSNFYRNQAKGIFSSSDVILCQGRYWKEYFIKNLNAEEEKCVVLNNWIDVESYKDSTFHSSSGDLKVLFLSRIEKNKGIYDLVKIIKKSEEGFQFIIAGEGSELDQLKIDIGLACPDKKVTFTGWISGKEKRKVLEDADMLLMLSYREGLPNVILEAMASKTAVISTTVGAVEDVIENQGNGLLVEPGDIGGVIKGMYRYLEDEQLRRSYTDISYRRVVEEFSTNNAVSVFKKCLEIG